MPAVLATAALLVPCHAAAHARLRPDDCTVCEGTGSRIARDAEVVFCGQGHEAELIQTPDGPEVEGWAPRDEEGPWRDEDGSLIFDCPLARCGDTITVTTRAAL